MTNQVGLSYRFLWYVFQATLTTQLSRLSLPKIPCPMLVFPQIVYCWGSQCNLTLVASVLVGVVAFLGSQVVLSPVVSGCLPLCVGVGVGWCGSLPGLSSRFVSGCLPLCVGVGVGWRGNLPGLSSRLVSRCLRLSHVVSLYVGVGVGWCGSLLGL